MRYYRIVFALGCFTLAAWWSLVPAEAGKAKKKTAPAETKVQGELFTFIAEEGMVTSVDVINKNPKGKFFQKIQSFDVDKGAKFILIEGTKQTSYTAKTVLTDPRAQSGFQKENLVTIEFKGNLAHIISFSPKKKDAK